MEEHKCNNWAICISLSCPHKKDHIPDVDEEEKCYETIGCSYFTDSVCISIEREWDK
jgi:hypothetical protein